MRANCEECGSEIAVHAGSGNYEWAAGLVPLRKRGANQLSFATRTGQFVCRTCRDLLVSGRAPLDGQESLFDE